MSKGNGRDDLFNAETLEGDGSVEMVLFYRADQVIMRFRRSILWVGFDPSNAVAAGKQLIDLAVACGANVELIVPRKELSPEKRAVLTQRTAHIVRSMSAGGRPIDFIAQQVVDSILAAIE